MSTLDEVLIQASFLRDVESIQELLAQGAKLDFSHVVRHLILIFWHLTTAEKLGRTSLHWVSFIGYDRVVSKLLALGASVDVTDTRRHSTPLGLRERPH
ncbi:hypothetical protein Ae201684P_012338 [Aphanomyces euteiches]|nr:hypothetical protein Ae201684P_012338 [Aphanomyces euteiches]